jgi:uncharacterized protein (TIGR03435 family)
MTHIRTCIMAAAIVIVGLIASAQTPRFDAASIKPNTLGDTGYRWTFENGRFTGTYVTPKMLIATAYGPPQQPLPDFQVEGGAAWLTSDRFDIVAAGPASAPLPGLLKQLLADRFTLRAHFETRDLPIYALTLARKDGTLGPKLRRNEADCAAIAAGRVSGERCGGTIMPGHVEARGMTMALVTSGLARLMPNVGRPVVDRTGLTGSFDIELTWMPDQPVVTTMPNVPMPAIDPDAPSLFTALQEQLGLKLDAQRGPVQVLVIDHADPPTGN